MMKKTILVLLTAGALAFAASGLIQSASARPMIQNDLINMPHTLSQQLQRACVFTGDWTIVDCSAAAAYSAELDEWARYVIQCTEDSYWTPTTVASGDDADSNDGYLPKGAWVEMVTTDLTTYYSCESSANSGNCKHIKCR